MASPISTKQITINVSPSYKCWRLIYNLDTKKALQLFESSGITQTANSLFCSDPTDGVTTGFVTSAIGHAEALSLISALGLSEPPAPPKANTTAIKK